MQKKKPVIDRHSKHSSKQARSTAAQRHAEARPWKARLELDTPKRSRLLAEGPEVKDPPPVDGKAGTDGTQRAVA